MTANKVRLGNKESSISIMLALLVQCRLAFNLKFNFKSALKHLKYLAAWLLSVSLRSGRAPSCSGRNRACSSAGCTGLASGSADVTLATHLASRGVLARCVRYSIIGARVHFGAPHCTRQQFVHSSPKFHSPPDSLLSIYI